MPLLGYLRGLGVVDEPVAVAEAAVDVLLDRYGDYLVVERGLDAGTARGYLQKVRAFIEGRLRGDGLDLAGLTAG